MLYENGEFERIRPHWTPLECGIIFDGIPEGAISRKVGLIWGIPVNLGGTYLSPEVLSPLWTSPAWMTRLIQLYPRVALKYRIRGNPGLPSPVASSPVVRHIWKHEADCYPVVRVRDYFYICAGGRASGLDLESHAMRDRWVVYMTYDGPFAQFLESEPENMLYQIQEASGIADRIKREGR